MKKNYKYNYNAQVFCKYQLIEPFIDLPAGYEDKFPLENLVSWIDGDKINAAVGEQLTSIPSQTGSHNFRSRLYLRPI